jgi:glycosyltransferase involved in cell wall biosynthesis
MARVLYLSYDGMTDPLGQSQVLPYLFGLSKLGHSITLVSFEKPERYKANAPAIRNLCQANNVNWQPLTYHKRPPVLSTVWDLSALYAKAIRLVLGGAKYDIVHCRSYVSSFVGMFLQRRFGIKFIFDIRGFWPEERVEGGLWNLSNPVYKTVYRFFKRRERQWFQHAAHVVSLTHAGKEDILARPELNLAADHITVIPCCVDTELFNPHTVSEADRAHWRTKLNITPGGFVLTYLGSIGTWYMLGEMLDFFARLLRKLPDAVFLFITQENAQGILKEAAARGIAEHNIRVQPAGRTQVPVLLSLGQASVFFIRPTYSKKSSSPTKQGEIMSMGIPLICNTGVGDTDAVVRQYNCGLLVDAFTTKGYDTVVAHLAQLAALPADAIRNAGIDYYGLEKGVRKYHAIYERIAG